MTHLHTTCWGGLGCVWDAHASLTRKGKKKKSMNAGSDGVLVAVFKCREKNGGSLMYVVRVQENKRVCCRLNVSDVTKTLLYRRVLKDLVKYVFAYNTQSVLTWARVDESLGWFRASCGTWTSIWADPRLLRRGRGLGCWRKALPRSTARAGLTRLPVGLPLSLKEHKMLLWLAEVKTNTEIKDNRFQLGRVMPWDIYSALQVSVLCKSQK